MERPRSCECCEHCLYICEGDFWCDERHEIIASDWGIWLAEPCDRFTKDEDIVSRCKKLEGVS